MYTNPKSVEEVLSNAIEVKQEMDEAIKITVRKECGFYGNRYVHFEDCKCERVFSYET